MQRRRWLAVLVVAWWFMAWNAQHGRVFGPFPTEAICEARRLEVRASPAFDAVQAMGGVSVVCWSDAGFAAAARR